MLHDGRVTSGPPASTRARADNRPRRRARSARRSATTGRSASPPAPHSRPRPRPARVDRPRIRDPTRPDPAVATASGFTTPSPVSSDFTTHCPSMSGSESLGTDSPENRNIRAKTLQPGRTVRVPRMPLLRWYAQGNGYAPGRSTVTRTVWLWPPLRLPVTGAVAPTSTATACGWCRRCGTRTRSRRAGPGPRTG